MLRSLNLTPWDDDKIDELRYLITHPAEIASNVNYEKIRHVLTIDPQGNLRYGTRKIVRDDQIDHVLDLLYRKGNASRDRLYDQVSGRFIGISIRRVLKFLNEQEGYQISKPWPSRKQSTGPGDSIVQQSYQPYDRFALDIIDLQALKVHNSNFSYIIVVIDVFSRYVAVRTLKTREAKEYLPRIRDIVNTDFQGKWPKVLQADNEFNNNQFIAMCTQHSTKTIFSMPYWPRSNSVVERVNGTLKRVLFKRMALQRNKRWVDILDEVVTFYNQSKHSGHGQRPHNVLQAYWNGDQAVIDATSDRNQAVAQKRISSIKYPQIRRGDSVRKRTNLTSKERKALTFRKSTKPNWSVELFTVYEVGRNGKIYLVGERQRGYSRNQLQLVDRNKLKLDPVAPKKERQPPKPRVPQKPARDIQGKDPLGVVGKNIKVYWPDDRKWREGKVKSYSISRGEYIVSYTQGLGDVWEDLSQETYEVL